MEAIRLGNVRYVLDGKSIHWYVNGKQEGTERFKSEWEARGVFDELR